jgi:hypothetical protein
MHFHRILRFAVVSFVTDIHMGVTTSTPRNSQMQKSLIVNQRFKWPEAYKKAFLIVIDYISILFILHRYNDHDEI